MVEYEIRKGNIKNVYIQIKEGNVIVKTPYHMSEVEIQQIVTRKEEWIKKTLKRAKQKEEREKQYTQEQFIEVITKQTAELVRLTNLHPMKVRVKEMKYAWGSCSRNKHISLNSKLICYSENAIRYVILHELCHIQYMNHSKSFWSLVGTYMPDYKEVKKEFRQ